MKLLEYFLVFSVVFLAYSASADGQTGNTRSTSPATSTQETEPANTPTAALTTVTIVTDTTPISNVTTSPEPANTTQAVITTTESPGSSDLMLVVNNSGNACIVAKLEITLNLEYENSNDSMVMGSYVIKSATVDNDKSSKCKNPAQDEKEELYAEFDGDNSLQFHFSNTSTSKFAVTLFQISSANLRNFFPDAKAGQNLTLQSNQSIFETSANMSFKCNSETKVDLVDTNRMATNNSVVFRMVQVEAFRTKADTNFAKAIDCEADDEISNLVPIAVGCALAGLVVVVLIAYLIGRRQKRQRGYESV